VCVCVYVYDGWQVWVIRDRFCLFLCQFLLPAISLAIEQNHAPIVQALLHANAHCALHDVKEIRARSGKTISSSIDHMVESRMLQRAAGVASKAGKYGLHRDLAEAVLAGNLRLVSEALRHPGLKGKGLGSVDRRDEEGKTLLWRAAFRGHTEVVRALLVFGSDLSVRSAGRKSPLEAAMGQNHVKVAKLLLDFGANTFAVDLETLRLESDTNVSDRMDELVKRHPPVAHVLTPDDMEERPPEMLVHISHQEFQIQKQIFRYFDADRDGYITVADLKTKLARRPLRRGPAFNEVLLRQMVREARSSRSMRGVCFEDFLHIINVPDGVSNAPVTVLPSLPRRKKHKALSVRPPKFTRKFNPTLKNVGRTGGPLIKDDMLALRQQSECGARNTGRSLRQSARFYSIKESMSFRARKPTSHKKKPRATLFHLSQRNKSKSMKKKSTSVGSQSARNRRVFRERHVMRNGSAGHTHSEIADSKRRAQELTQVHMPVRPDSAGGPLDEEEDEEEEDEEEFNIHPALMEEAVYMTQSSLPAHYSARRGSRGSRTSGSGTHTPTHRRRSSYLKLPEHLRAKRDEEEEAAALEREQEAEDRRTHAHTPNQCEVLSTVGRKREQRKQSRDITGYLLGRVSEDNNVYAGYMQATGGQPEVDRELQLLLEGDASRDQAEPDLLDARLDQADVLY
jgi:hypothetical protein